jgi:hypothetical protein
MSHVSLMNRVRNLIGRHYDQQHRSEERFAATRMLQISAIPGPHGIACGATVTLIGTPTRGMVVISDLGYTTGGGVDVLAGKALSRREVALVRQFVAEAAQRAISQLASDFSWSSASENASVA